MNKPPYKLLGIHKQALGADNLPGLFGFIPEDSLSAVRDEDGKRVPSRALADKRLREFLEVEVEAAREEMWRLPWYKRLFRRINGKQN